MKKVPVFLQVVVVIVLVFLIDWFLTEKEDASVLVGLLFWSGIGQGLIALAAAADLSQGRWFKEIRGYLEAYGSLLLIFPLVFLVYCRHLTVYDWVHTLPSVWLNSVFFMLRNVIFLLWPVIMAHIYIRTSKKESPRRGLAAVLYLISFVISQSFMAYDVVMTFEYPFINTLFGGYFFVEALYAGIAFSAIHTGLLMLKEPGKFRGAFRDFVTMIIGFSLFWAGLFYSQYLVIWYGNIPEEVLYISKRIHEPLLRNMGIYILIAIFLVPFLALISRRVKSSVVMVSVISLLVCSGLIVERLIFLMPVVHLDALASGLILIVIGVPYVALMLSQYKNIYKPLV